jgi:8-oxo-dGTP pyrophosphatase MutT (NUDIX family)
VTRASGLQRRLRLVLMLALRYTPLPWPVKHRAIRQMMPKALLVSIAIIPDDAGRVLMLRARYSGHWLLPGGTLEAGEDPLHGLNRECREELGGSVTVERLTGIYAFPAQREMFFAFRCAPLAAPPSLSEEHESWRYARPEEITSPVRRAVHDALADFPQICIGRLP